MRIQFIKQLPIQRVGYLTAHPEIHHLELIEQAVKKLEGNALLIEDGPINGALTYVLLCGMDSLPEARLVIRGQTPDHIKEMVTRLGKDSRVTYEPADYLPPVPPSLWFVGRTDVRLSVDQALNVQSRVIIVYDVRTSERYTIKTFKENAQASKLLFAQTGRRTTEVSHAIHLQQCRRGMTVSELKVWPPADNTELDRQLRALLPVALHPHIGQLPPELKAVEQQLQALKPVEFTPDSGAVRSVADLVEERVTRIPVPVEIAAEPQEVPVKPLSKKQAKFQKRQAAKAAAQAPVDEPPSELDPEVAPE